MNQENCNRTAIYAIKGYLYQFNHSILSILNANDCQSIEIEGIEDIDIGDITEKNAIQYKYYETREYNHSVIKPAIEYMLQHFSQNKNSELNYSIYGNFKMYK